MANVQMLDTIVDIYSAPGSSNKWGSALESITHLVGGKAAAYLLINNADRYVGATSSFGYSEEVKKKYTGRSGSADTDVRFKYLHNLTPGMVFRDMEFVESRDEWNLMPWNVFEREELGLYYCLTAQISTHGVWMDLISVNRLESKGPNTDEEKQDLQQLLPHLSRAAELNRLVNRLDEMYGLVLSVLDQLMIGVIIVDKQQRVVTANASACDISERSGAFNCVGSRVKMTAVEADGSLSNILQRSIGTAIGSANDQGESLVVQSRRDHSKLLFDIMPLRDDGFSDSDGVKGAVIFILDPTADYPFSVTGLREIFNLTTSETQVGQLLVNGLSVSQIAEQRDTRPDTVRDQLKSIYQKTDTTGQLDLLRKVVRADLPIKK